MVRKNQLLMSEDNFVISREEGRTGELYVQKHLNELIMSVAFDAIDTSAEKIEGKDFIASSVDQETGEIIEAAVEVKTVRGFLFRTNDNEATYGTIGFELWKSEKRKSLGWLLQMMMPDGKKSIQPEILVFLLIEYDCPFASIAFTDVPALFNRLRQISTDIKFDLNNLPVGEQADSFTIPDGLLIQNMWMIPLEQLEDLAHIVMIGERPRLRPTIKAPGHLCKIETQQERYSHLQLLADNNTLPFDEDFEFKGDQGTQTITVVAKNLGILETLNLEHYESLKYMNRTGTFLRLWEGLYKFMLSCEFPERKYKGSCYYPISYRKISSWGYLNDIRSLSDTWSGVIKHLLEFGLLKHFRPHPKSTNKIDVAVNRNNPYPKSVEYYSPVELTGKLLMEADCYAQDYKRNRRPTSTISRSAMEFQSDRETANRAYQDDRKLTKQDRYVRKIAEHLLDEEIDKHKYITVEIFFAKLWKEIIRIQKIKQIETIQSLNDQKEQKRYKKYLSALNLLRKKKKDFISDLRIYKIGLVTKKDKFWLGNIPNGTYIITYKDRPDLYNKQYYAALEEYRKRINTKRRAKRRTKKKEDK